VIGEGARSRYGVGSSLSAILNPVAWGKITLSKQDKGLSGRWR
jgi:hypothetical protein